MKTNAMGGSKGGTASLSIQKISRALFWCALAGMAHSMLASAQVKAGMRAVRPVESQEVLVNPGIGFTTFQRFNGDLLNEGDNWPEGFPIEYEALQARGSAPRAYPESTVAYLRIYWRFIEPEEGRYDWDQIDRALAAARAHGQRLMLRVPAYGSTLQDSDVPAWYRVKNHEPLPGNGAQAASQKIEPKWLVDPENPGYARDYGRLVRALGARYDGNPDLEAVDIGLVGAWGEGAGSDRLTESTRHALVQAYIESFHRTPLLAQPQDGASVGEILAGSRAATGSPASPAVGWRADCLGDMRPAYAHMIDYYPEKLIQLHLTDLWKTAPVSMESCWVMQTWLDRGWDIDYILDKAIQWHVSTFNNKSSAVPAALEPKVKAWLNRMGYRFVLERFTWTATVDRSRKLEFGALVTNKGDAPIYRPYQLALRIRGAQTEQIFVTDAPLEQWLPGDSYYESAVFLPSGLADGAYQIDVALVDPGTRKPAVKMAIEGVAADGWYPMGAFELRAQTTH